METILQQIRDVEEKAKQDIEKEHKKLEKALLAARKKASSLIVDGKKKADQAMRDALMAHKEQLQTQKAKKLAVYEKKAAQLRLLAKKNHDETVSFLYKEFLKKLK